MESYDPFTKPEEEKPILEPENSPLINIYDEKISPLRKVMSGVKEKAKKAAQIAALLSTLGSTPETKAEDQKGAQPTAQIENQKQITNTEKALLLQQTGIDIASIAESANFNVKIEVPNENGEYLVHIGQSHKTKDTLNNKEERERIIDSQKNIEKVLLSMHNQGINTVFSEAVSADKQAVNEFIMKMYEGIRNDLSLIPTDSGFQRLREYQMKKINQMEEIKLSLGEDAHVADELGTTINYLCKTRALEMYKEMKKNGTLTPETETAFKDTLQTFSPIGALEPLGDDAIYYIGAVDKLKNEGKFYVSGAETSEGNKIAFEYRKEFEAVRQEYLATRDTATPERLEELNRKAKEIRQKIDQATLENRENIAVDLINKSANSNPTSKKVVVMVYGSDHDFKNNVIEANKHSQHPIGLIKLEPRQ